MTRKYTTHILPLITLYILCVCSAEEETDDFFSMSPAELANISIATGTAKPATSSYPENFPIASRSSYLETTLRL